MRYIVANPGNGSEIDAHGVLLDPGYELEVIKSVADDLKKSFEFLLVKVVPGKDLTGKKRPGPVKTKGDLQWQHTDHNPSDPQPHTTIFTLNGEPVIIVTEADLAENPVLAEAGVPVGAVGEPTDVPPPPTEGAAVDVPVPPAAPKAPRKRAPAKRRR